MQLIDMSGRVVHEYGRCPVKYYIDIGDHPEGDYFLRVKTNLKTTTKRVTLRK